MVDYSHISPVLIVALKDVHTFKHSGGGVNVHVFFPTNWACHDGEPT